MTYDDFEGFQPLSKSDGKVRQYNEDGPKSCFAFNDEVTKFLNEKKWLGGKLRFYPVEGEFADTLDAVDKQSCIDHYVILPNGLVFAISSRVHFWADRTTYPEKHVTTRVHRGRKWPDYDEVETEYHKIKKIHASDAMHPNYIVETYLGRDGKVLYIAIVRWCAYVSFLLSHTLEMGTRPRFTRWDHEIPIIKNKDGTWFSVTPAEGLKRRMLPGDVEIYEG